MACNRLAELNRALNLVRAVGMNDEMASDWLASAVVELRELPDSAFLAGVQHARRTCTHHAQIVPTVLAEGGKAQTATTAERFLDDWNNSVKAFFNGYETPRLTGKSEVQQLIEATANDLTAR